MGNVLQTLKHHRDIYFINMVNKRGHKSIKNSFKCTIQHRLNSTLFLTFTLCVCEGWKFTPIIRDRRKL